MFSIGQKVVCVDDCRSSAQVNTFPIAVCKGTTYTIHSIRGACTCGEQLLDVGICSGFVRITCRCGRVHRNDGNDWFCASRFSSIEEKSETERKPQREELSTVTYEDIEAFMEIANP
jgi:hypothetical protein